MFLFAFRRAGTNAKRGVKGTKTDKTGQQEYAGEYDEDESPCTCYRSGEIENADYSCYNDPDDPVC